MTKDYGRIRKPGRPREDGYDLQLMLQVDVGAALAGKSVNAFIDTAASARPRRTLLEAGTIRRRYYERRKLMTPVVWPDGRCEESPTAKAYARFLAEVTAVFQLPD